MDDTGYQNAVKVKEPVVIKEPAMYNQVASIDMATEPDISVCEGGASPDSLGCCPGEEYTYTADGFMCCNDDECFPPIED